MRVELFFFFLKDYYYCHNNYREKVLAIGNTGIATYFENGVFCVCLFVDCRQGNCLSFVYSYGLASLSVVLETEVALQVRYFILYALDVHIGMLRVSGNL